MGKRCDYRGYLIEVELTGDNRAVEVKVFALDEDRKVAGPLSDPVDRQVYEPAPDQPTDVTDDLILESGLVYGLEAIDRLMRQFSDSPV